MFVWREFIHSCVLLSSTFSDPCLSTPAPLCPFLQNHHDGGNDSRLSLVPMVLTHYSQFARCVRNHRRAQGALPGAERFVPGEVQLQATVLRESAGSRESHRRAYRLPRVCCVVGSFPSSYSVLPMAINNDMVIAVAAEDNDKDATEFAIYNTVGFSLGF